MEMKNVEKGRKEKRTAEDGASRERGEQTERTEVGKKEGKKD